jgi:ParB family transcriptional regulator, chromosome partitioning protein
MNMQTIQNSFIQSSTYRDLPITQLQESPFNPRKRFAESSLEELAQSIRAQGVLAPLLVRELEPEHFEIVAGSRRFRASQLARLEQVPVRIVTLSDAEAQLAMAVENLQREDVHPLEEARAFANLLQQQYDIATIASKVGRGERFVAERIRLNELIPAVAEAFLEDKITVGHALPIAKLPASQQPEAFNAAFRRMWTTQGDTQTLVPVKELASWIETNILLDLTVAAFDCHDRSLLPEAGSCDECPKRTGANTLLFPGEAPDSCLDKQCYAAKTDRHIARALEQKPELVQISSSWGSRNGAALGRNRYVEVTPSKNGNVSKAAQKRCSHLTKGIVVDGGSRGQILTICAEPGCTVHHTQAQESRQAAEKARQEQRKQNEKRKLELTTRHRVLAAVLAKVSAPLSKPDLILVATALLERLIPEYAHSLAIRHKLIASEDQSRSANDTRLIKEHLKTLDETGLGRFLIEASVIDSATNPYVEGELLDAAAKRYRVDVKKIAESMAAEFATKQKKREERRTTAAPKAQQGKPRNKAKSKS